MLRKKRASPPFPKLSQGPIPPIIVHKVHYNNSDIKEQCFVKVKHTTSAIAAVKSSLPTEN